jgi:hypothetical protein
VSKIFAIGGPYNFQWVEDYGSAFNVAIPRNIEASFFKPEIVPLDIDSYDTYIYYKHIIADFETKKNKLYIGQNLPTDKGVYLLKEYLLQQFILMEVD